MRASPARSRPFPFWVESRHPTAPRYTRCAAVSRLWEGKWFTLTSSHGNQRRSEWHEDGSCFRHFRSGNPGRQGRARPNHLRRRTPRLAGARRHRRRSRETRRPTGRPPGTEAQDCVAARGTATRASAGTTDVDERPRALVRRVAVGRIALGCASDRIGLDSLVNLGSRAGWPATLAIVNPQVAGSV